MKPLLPILLLPFIALAGDTPTNPATPSPRYQLLSAPLTAAGDTTDLQLQVILRLDTATGRTWRLAATSGTVLDTNTLRWIPIAEPISGLANLHPKPPTEPNPQQTRTNFSRLHQMNGCFDSQWVAFDSKGVTAASVEITSLYA